MCHVVLILWVRLLVRSLRPDVAHCQYELLESRIVTPCQILNKSPDNVVFEDNH